MVSRSAARIRDESYGRLLKRQPWLSRYVRVFCLLVLSQAACLALGLWLESRFIGSLVMPAGVDVLNASPTLDASATAMTIMAFFWIAALQAAVAYLVLSRVCTEAERKKIAATGESIKRQNELVRTRDAIIFGLAKLAESRDPETGNHLERIVLYSTRLVAALQRHPRYRRQINSNFVELIGIGAALHDIGKVGVKDSVLLKTGNLDETERAMMELHPQIGGKCIKDIELRLGSSNFLQMAREIAFSHHERWDGSGYPNKLRGEEIPLSARIVSVCDVYDALSVQRIYKDGFTHQKCVEMIREGAGSQFDPVIVDVFLEIQSEFRDIALRYADPLAEQEPDDGDYAVETPRTLTPEDEFEAITSLLADLLPGSSPGLSNELELFIREESRQKSQTIGEFPCSTSPVSSNSS